MDLSDTIAIEIKKNLTWLKSDGSNVDVVARSIAKRLTGSSRRNTIDAKSFAKEANKTVAKFLKGENEDNVGSSPQLFQEDEENSIDRILFQHLSLSQMAAQQMAIVALFQQRDLLLRQRKLLPDLMDRTLRTGEMYSTAPQWLQMWDTEKMKPLRVREQKLVESCILLDKKLSMTRESLSRVRKSVHATLARELVSAMNNYDSAYDDLMMHDSRWLRRIKTIADIHRAFHEEDDRQVPAPESFVSSKHNELAYLSSTDNEHARRHSLKCLIWLYAQASTLCAPGGILEQHLQRWAEADHGRVEMGPLKGLERSFQKAYENYAGDFTCLRDLARGSIEFSTARQICRCLRRILEDESVIVVRVKPRLAPSWDAASSGGYRDVLVNLCFKDAKSEHLHIVEVQLHLSSFLALKHRAVGGHRTYRVARTLRVFDKSRTRPTISDVNVKQMTSVALGTVQTLDLSHLQLLPSQAIILEEALKTAAHRSCVRELILQCANEHSVDRFASETDISNKSSISLLSLDSTGELPISPMSEPLNNSPESIVKKSSPRHRNDALKKMRRFSSKGPGEMRSLMREAVNNSHNRRRRSMNASPSSSSSSKNRVDITKPFAHKIKESLSSKSLVKKKMSSSFPSLSSKRKISIVRKITPDHISSMRQQWMQAANKMSNHHNRLGEMANAAAMCARNRGDTAISMSQNDEKQPYTPPLPDNLGEDQKKKKKKKKKNKLSVNVTAQRGVLVDEGLICPTCMFQFQTVKELKRHAKLGCKNHDGGFRISRPRNMTSSSDIIHRPKDDPPVRPGYIDDEITARILRSARQILKATPRERMSYRVIKQQLSVRFDHDQLEARKGRLKDLMLSLTGVSPGEEQKIQLMMAEASARSDALTMTNSLYGDLENSHSISSKNDWTAMKDKIFTNNSSINQGGLDNTPGVVSEDFDLSGTDFSGIDSPRTMRRNGLGISQCRSIGRGLHFGGRCLRVLNLRESRVEDKGLELLLKYRFANLLQHLDLSRCEEITDRGLSAVATRCVGLRVLALECCFSITDLGVKHIAKRCPNLMSVDLTRCAKVSDVGIQSIISSCENLEKLILSGCKALTDDALASFLAALRVGSKSCTTTSKRPSIFDDDFYESADEDDEEEEEKENGDHVNEKIKDEKEREEKTQFALYRYRLRSFLDSADRCDDKLCSSLIHLDLGNCRHFSDGACLLLAESCMRLETLRLDRCSKISDSGVVAIATHCQSIQSFSLNQCTKITDISVTKIAMCCTQLEKLSLWCCPEISDVSLRVLGKRASSLRDLNVKSCPLISDKGIEQLARGCTQLRCFALQRCSVTGKGIVTLAKSCPELNTLEIGAISITDNGLRQVSRACKNLNFITLFNCDAITQEGLRFLLRYCNELQDIDIWGCKNFVTEIKSVSEAFMYVSNEGENVFTSGGSLLSSRREDSGDLARISKALDNIAKRSSSSGGIGIGGDTTSMMSFRK